MRKWNKSEENLLRKTYLGENKTIEETAKILERSPAAIFNRTSKLGIKKNPSKFKFPPLCCEIARVHAHICGDGYLTISKETNRTGFYRRWGYDNSGRVSRYIIAYSNKNRSLINEFIEDIKKCFGVKPILIKKKDKNYEVRLKSKRAWKFLKSLGAGNSYSWSIPELFLEAPLKIKKAWINAFFDDEAHFAKDGRIRVKSVNRKGLNQIRLMLHQLVPCHITPQEKSYTDKTYYLNILKSNRKRFIILFKPRKAKNLAT